MAKYLITAVFNWIGARPLVIVGIGIVLALAIGGGIDSCYSRRYDKQRAAYEAQSKANASRIADLEGQNAALRKQIESLEPKALAYTAIVDSKIKVDERLKDRIEKVTEGAANAENTASNAVPCRVRADRLCTLFRSGDRNFDCNILFAECRQ